MPRLINSDNSNDNSNGANRAPVHQRRTRPFTSRAEGWDTIDIPLAESSEPKVFTKRAIDETGK